jgi:molybdenum cofactor biosynthesis enzyme MoaA
MEMNEALDFAYIDTVDSCQLKCPTCVRGLRLMANSSRKMSIDLFEQIIAKVKFEGYRRIGLFNYTEPFLNRTLQAYVAKVNQIGIPCEISSTFSMRHIDNLEETLCAGVSVMHVSMSGMDQATYEINHVDGVLEYVLRNLTIAANIIRTRGLSGRLMMRFIRFDYNAHQIPEAQAFADKIGVGFEVIEGVGDPRSKEQRRFTDEFYRDEMSRSSGKTSPEELGKVCTLMFDQVAIDCVGDVFICCAMPTHPSLRIGNYLTLSASEILLKRYTHSFCRTCTIPRREATTFDRSRLLKAVGDLLAIQSA